MSEQTGNIISIDELRIAINNIKELLLKYGGNKYIDKVRLCEKLILDKNEIVLLEYINSITWWGENSISDTSLATSNIIKDQEYKDEAVFQKSLMLLAKYISSKGVENNFASEYLYQSESWLYK